MSSFHNLIYIIKIQSRHGILTRSWFKTVVIIRNVVIRNNISHGFCILYCDEIGLIRRNFIGWFHKFTNRRTKNCIRFHFVTRCNGIVLLRNKLGTILTKNRSNSCSNADNREYIFVSILQRINCFVRICLQCLCQSNVVKVNVIVTISVIRLKIQCIIKFIIRYGNRKCYCIPFSFRNLCNCSGSRTKVTITWWQFFQSLLLIRTHQIGVLAEYICLKFIGTSFIQFIGDVHHRPLPCFIFTVKVKYMCIISFNRKITSVYYIQIVFWCSDATVISLFMSTKHNSFDTISGNCIFCFCSDCNIFKIYVITNFGSRINRSFRFRSCKWVCTLLWYFCHIWCCQRSECSHWCCRRYRCCSVCRCCCCRSLRCALCWFCSNNCSFLYYSNFRL